jgi:hypothetical protein
MTGKASDNIPATLGMTPHAYLSERVKFRP